MIRLTAALAVALCLAATSTLAETAFEMTFRSGTLDSFEVGDRLEYQSSTATENGAEAETLVSVELAGDGIAALEQREVDGLQRTLGNFDASVGNPLAMFFLERTIRSVADGTGGSDFYLRNRFKDALRDPDEMRPVQVDWDGRQIEATELVVTPFKNDPNRSRLGRFGDLRIRLVVGDGIPGWYHTLEANTSDYRSVISLAEVER